MAPREGGYTKKQKFILAVIVAVGTALSGFGGGVIKEAFTTKEKEDTKIAYRNIILQNNKEIDSLKTEMKYMKMSDAAMLISINELNKKRDDQQTTLTQLITIIKLKWNINL